MTDFIIALDVLFLLCQLFCVFMGDYHPEHFERWRNAAYGCWAGILGVCAIAFIMMMSEKI